MIQQYESCHEVLRHYFEKRCENNPLYSLRSFARDLEIAPSSLSSIFNQKQKLSKVKAQKISEILGMNESEKEFFTTLADAESTRNKINKQKALDKIKKWKEKSADHGYVKYRLEMLKVISQWHHFAIMELTQLDGFKDSIDWIAKQLEITTAEVEDAIHRMINLGLLKREKGRLIDTNEHLAVGGDIPSETIKDIHRNILKKAARSLDERPVIEREFSSTLMAIDKNDLPKAKEKLRELRREFSKDIQKTHNKNAIYNLSLQFFEVTARKLQ